MNTLKSALIAASIAFAGPALAGGGASFVYFPNLAFPDQTETVTRNQATLLAKSGDQCTASAYKVTIHSDACGISAKTELVKRKPVAAE